MLKLNEKLHLVIPVYADDTASATVIAYIHSAPISREVFEAHFMLIGKVFSALYSQGLGMIAGPRMAYLMLRRIAENDKDEEGALSLMNEIRRLTNVLMRTAAGWDMLPFQDVVDHGDLPADDIAEAVNSIVFFIATSSMRRGREKKDVLTGAAKIWDAQISSLDCTAFGASLKISKSPAVTTPNPLPESAAVF